MLIQMELMLKDQLRKVGDSPTWGWVEAQSPSQNFKIY